MLITLITDASYFSQTQTGGWAAWARSSRGVMPVCAGPLKGNPRSASEAEAMAFANGIARLIKSGITRPGDRVLAQIDNMAVVHRLDGTRCKPMPSVKRPIEAALALATAAGLSISARHIKAHVGTDQPRNFIHDAVDQAARNAARRVHEQRKSA